MLEGQQNHTIIIPGSLFESSESKQIAGAMMKRLRLAPEWKLIEEILEYNLKYLNNVIDTTDFGSKEEFEEVRLIKRVYENISKLPSKVISEVQDDNISPAITFDPYDDPYDA